MFLVLILNPKRQPWQGNILVMDTIIINMVDTENVALPWLTLWI
jgi:hypothetical protein